MYPPGPGGTIPDALNRKENHDKLEKSLHAAIDESAANGVPNVITFSGNRKGMADREGADNCVAFLNKVKAHAEDKGVTICMEYLNSKVNHKDYMFDHIAWGVDVMKRVNSPRVKILFDIYHAQIMDGDIVRNIRDHFQWIGHFHTGGNPGRHDIDETQELNYHFIASHRRSEFHRLHLARIFPRAGARSDRDAEQSHRDLRCLGKTARMTAAARFLFCMRRALFAQAGRTDRQMPDPAAADRGKRVYLQFCINCHGSQAQGTEDGPDLIRSADGLARPAWERPRTRA